MKKAQKEIKVAVLQLEKLLAEGTNDALSIQQRTGIPLENSELRVPSAIEHSSVNTHLMGYWETLARNYVDLSYRSLQTLAQGGADAFTEYQRIKAQIATRALDALICEIQVYARTNQHNLPPERQRHAASYMPLLNRIADLYPPTETNTRLTEARTALEQLVLASDPAVAVQAETNLQHKAKLLRTRTKYELIILLFFVAVVGVIIVYYKSPLNTNIQRGNSPFGVPIEERAGEGRPPQ